MKRALLTIAVSAVLLGSPTGAHADEAELQKEIDVLRAEMVTLRAEIAALRNQPTAPGPAAQPETTAVQPEAAAAKPPTTTLWGYGEMNYNRPRRDPASAQADVRRAVLGFGHSFSDSTRVLGELEWEHAVVSREDQGESEVEQLFVEHTFNARTGARAGLILIPLGLLNEHHEPGSYYGVERNLVETAIIPSTWREGGVNVFGSTTAGLSWSSGVTTGFDLSRWDSTSSEGLESPLASIHQELQLAHAHDLSFFAAANYQGILGLTAGGGAFTGKIGQGQDFAGRASRLLLGEAHARWQSGPLDLSALYARGTISDTEALNRTFAGNPTPVPSSFWGGYVQAAWRVWGRGDQALTPFVRLEAVNTAASYAAVPPGLGVAPARTEHVFTGGMNYWLADGVVVKADVQHFSADRTLDRFDLGIGYQF